MSTHAVTSETRLLASVLLVMLVAMAADAGVYEDDWSRVEMGGMFGRLSHDIAAKPGSDTVGVVRFVLGEGNVPKLMYAEYYGGDAWLEEEISSLPDFNCAALRAALAYTASGSPVVCYAYNHTTWPSGPFTTPAQCSRLEFVEKVAGTGWTSPELLDERWHDMDPLPPVGDTSRGFFYVDVALDRRPAHLDEVHATYSERLLFVEESGNEEDVTTSSAIYAVHRDLYGTWHAPEQLDYLGPQQGILRHRICDTSVAASSVSEPELAFDYCTDYSSEGLGYEVGVASWNGSSWDVADDRFDGRQVTLDVDPNTGYPRIAYLSVGTDQDIYSCAKDASGWSVPDLIFRAVYLGTPPYQTEIRYLYYPALDAGVNSFGATIWQLAFCAHDDPKDIPGGTWAATSTTGGVTWSGGSRVSYNGSAANVLVNANSMTPYVFTSFGSEPMLLCLTSPTASTPSQCGTTPVRRNGIAGTAFWKAVIPLAAALAAIAAWYIASNRRTRSRGPQAAR